MLLNIQANHNDTNSNYEAVTVMIIYFQFTFDWNELIYHEN